MSTLIQLPEGSICWSAASLPAVALDVQHARTRVQRARTAGRRCSGSTRWERCFADGSAWLEWDWLEIDGGAVVQADPLNVRCNVLLLDDRQRPLLCSRRRVMLATLVYLLPWQGPVLDMLHGLRGSPRTSGLAMRLAA